MNGQSQQATGLRRLAVTAAIATFVLLPVGNLVTVTGSGMGCGEDWPHCNGHIVPEFLNHTVAIEYGHRVLAGVVSLLTLALTALAWRGPDRVLRRWTLAASVLLMAQVILGAITVKLSLPPEVIILHLAFSQLFLAALVVATLRTRPAPPPATAAATAADPGFARLAMVALVLTYLQSVLGAYMRHLGAGMVCQDIVACNRVLTEGLRGLNGVHFGHWGLGLLAGGTVIALALRAVRIVSPHKNLASAAAAIALLQLVFGFGSVFSGLSVAWTSLHMAGAAGLLTVLVMLVYRIGRRADGPAAAQAASHPIGHNLGNGTART